MRISILIPLYKSARFYSILRDNITEHLNNECEILISDQHLLDDTVKRLKKDFADQTQIRYFTSNCAMNWVENINLLIHEAKGCYIRILPHDDSSTWLATNLLANELDRFARAAVAYGIVKAFNLSGERLPEKDENTKEQTIYSLNDESYIEGVDLFWRGRHPGSFKGLIRKKIIDQYNLKIIPTPELIFSERLWLVALRLAGHFVFVKQDMLDKRYYPESTHKQWKITDQNKVDAAVVINRYIQKILSPDKIKLASKNNWFYCYSKVFSGTNARDISAPWKTRP